MASLRPKSWSPPTDSCSENSHIFMAVNGLRISCATLAASLPTAASFSAANRRLRLRSSDDRVSVMSDIKPRNRASTVPISSAAAGKGIGAGQRRTVPCFAEQPGVGRQALQRDQDAAEQQPQQPAAKANRQSASSADHPSRLAHASGDPGRVFPDPFVGDRGNPQTKPVGLLELGAVDRRQEECSGPFPVPLGG